jgi:hypothetical protein
MGDENGSSDLEQRAVLDLQELQAASAELRRCLEENEAATAVLVEGLADGEPLTTIFERIRSSEMRPLVTDALTRFERIRHRGRLRLVAVATQQGMSVEEIQKRWAITRSLAIRNLREAERLV